MPGTASSLQCHLQEPQMMFIDAGCNNRCSAWRRSSYCSFDSRLTDVWQHTSFKQIWSSLLNCLFHILTYFPCSCGLVPLHSTSTCKIHVQRLLGFKRPIARSLSVQRFWLARWEGIRPNQWRRHLKSAPSHSWTSSMTFPNLSENDVTNIGKHESGRPKLTLMWQMTSNGIRSHRQLSAAQKPVSINIPANVHLSWGSEVMVWKNFCWILVNRINTMDINN